MTRQDLNVELARYQVEISLPGWDWDSQNLIFNYTQKNETVRLDLVTVNPKHEQSFLFHTVVGTDKIDALKKMLEYIDMHYSQEGSMTIQWVKVGENKLHTSYFRAKNMYEALDTPFITAAIWAPTRYPALRQPGKLNIKVEVMC